MAGYELGVGTLGGHTGNIQAHSSVRIAGEQRLPVVSPRPCPECRGWHSGSRSSRQSNRGADQNE